MKNYGWKIYLIKNKVYKGAMIFFLYCLIIFLTNHIKIKISLSLSLYIYFQYT